MRILIILLAGYVQNRCNGQRDIALSAGFETKRKRSASLPMAAPGDVRAERSIFPGCIELRWRAVKGRKVYAVWLTDGDPLLPEGWQLLAQTSRNHLAVNDLERFKTYSFRVVALGALGYGPVSDVAMATAA